MQEQCRREAGAMPECGRSDAQEGGRWEGQARGRSELGMMQEGRSESEARQERSRLKVGERSE